MTNSGCLAMGGDGALKSSIMEKNEYFKRMVNLIPAKHYLDRETKRAGEKFFKNLKDKAPRQEIKLKTTKHIRKKQRLDPDAGRDLNVTEIQDALSVKEQLRLAKREAHMAALRKARKDEEDESSDGGEMNIVEGGMQGFGDDDGKDWFSRPVKPVKVEKVQSNASISDLRQKVQERIENLKVQRHAKSLEGNLTSKKTSKKDKAIAEKKRRKQQRYEAIKASRELKASLTKPKTDESEPVPNEPETAATLQSPSDQAKVAFSKFHFEEGAIQPKKQKKQKRKKNSDVNLSGRNYKALLKKVQDKKERISEIRKSDPEKAEEIVLKDKWKVAMDRTEGKKVRDDPNLLKKSIRKKKEKKKQGEKKWKERAETVKEQKADKQKKRQKNLKERKDARMSKKVKRLQKKGKLLLKDSDYS